MFLAVGAWNLFWKKIFLEFNLNLNGHFFVGSCITKNVHTPIELCTKQILIRLICIFDTFNIWSWQTKRTKKIFGPTLMRIIDKVKGCDWFHPLRVIWANEKTTKRESKIRRQKGMERRLRLATRWRFRSYSSMWMYRVYCYGSPNKISYLQAIKRKSERKSESPLAVVRCGRIDAHKFCYIFQFLWLLLPV